jgi:acyl carrier protein
LAWVQPAIGTDIQRQSIRRIETMDEVSVVEHFIVHELLLADDQTRVTPDQSLLQGGVLDSLSVLRLISFIEEQFGVTIEDEEVVPENFETINNIQAMLARKRA